MSTLQYADAFNTPTVEALEPIDIGLDEQELKGLSHTLQVLHQYMATFNDQRAVCQAQVRQLIDECDIALDTRYPLQSFTKAPSEQNLSAVTESVVGRIGSGFVEYCKKVWEFIKKILSWIITAIKRVFRREDQVMTDVAVIREVQSASKQIKSISPRGASKPANREEQEKHAERALAEYHEAVEIYNGQMTHMGMEMLTQGKYVAAVKALAFGSLGMVKALNTKLEEIQRRINTHNTLGENPTFENFKGLIDVEKAPRGTIDATMAWFGISNRIEEWSDITRLFLSQAKQIAEEPPPGSAMEWDIAARVIVNPNSGLAEPMVPASNAMQEYVEGMEPIIKAMSEHRITRSIDATFAKEAEETLNNFQEDVRSMLQFMEIANITLDCQYHLVHSVAQCAKAEFQVECAKHMIDDSTRESVIAIRNSLSAKIAKIKAN